jgi:hypothetical protein
MKMAEAIALAFVVALIVPMLPSSTAVADSSCFVPSCWVQVGTVYPPDDQGPNYVFAMTYANSANISLLGIVFLVVHNSLGQTLEISTGSVVLAAGANGTAFPVVFGLAPGMYNGTYFVISAAGTAMSSASTLNFTVSP